MTTVRSAIAARRARRKIRLPAFRGGCVTEEREGAVHQRVTSPVGAEQVPPGRVNVLLGNLTPRGRRSRIQVDGTTPARARSSPFEVPRSRSPSGGAPAYGTTGGSGGTSTGTSAAAGAPQTASYSACRSARLGSSAASAARPAAPHRLRPRRLPRRRSQRPRHSRTCPKRSPKQNPMPSPRRFPTSSPRRTPCRAPGGAPGRPRQAREVRV